MCASSDPDESTGRLCGAIIVRRGYPSWFLRFAAANTLGGMDPPNPVHGPADPSGITSRVPIPHRPRQRWAFVGVDRLALHAPSKRSLPHVVHTAEFMHNTGRAQALANPTVGSLT